MISNFIQISDIDTRNIYFQIIKNMCKFIYTKLIFFKNILIIIIYYYNNNN